MRALQGTVRAPQRSEDRIVELRTEMVGRFDERITTEFLERIDPSGGRAAFETLLDDIGRRAALPDQLWECAGRARWLLALLGPPRRRDDRARRPAYRSAATPASSTRSATTWCSTSPPSASPRQEDILELLPRNGVSTDEASSLTPSLQPDPSARPLARSGELMRRQFGIVEHACDPRREAGTTEETMENVSDTATDDPLREVEEVSLEEGRELLDRAARRDLNISGDEFVHAWDNGLITEPDSLRVQQIAALLPFGR